MGNQQAVSRDAFDELQTKYYALDMDYKDCLADLDMKKIETSKANEAKELKERKLNELKLILIPPEELNDKTADDTPEEIMKNRKERYNQLTKASEYIEEYKKYKESAQAWKERAEHFDQMAETEYNNSLQYRKEYEEEVVDIQSKIESGLPEEDQLLKQQLVAERAGHLARANWDYKVKGEYERKITEVRKNAIALRKDLVSEEDLPSYNKALDEIDETNRKYAALESDHVALEASFKALDTWLNTEKEKIIAQRDADILVYTNQIKEKDNDISNKEQEIKRLNESLEQSDAANESLQNEIDGLHSDYASLEAVLKESQETVAQRDEEIKNLKQSLVDFENKYNLDMAKWEEKYNTNMALMDSRIEEMNREKEEASRNSKNIINSIRVAAKSAINKYTDAENELKNQLNDKQEQIQVLSTEMSDLQAKSDDNERKLNAKIQQLDASNKDYIQQMGDLQDEIEEKENMINQLSEDKENAIKRGDGLELDLVTLRNTIRALKTEVNQTLQTVGVETVFQDDETTDDIKNAVNSTIISYNGRINDLNEEADKLQQTISDYEKRDDEQRETIKSLNTTKNENAVKISELEDEIEDLESEIADLKKEYDELKASTDAEIARLLASIAAKEDELERTKKEDADTLNNTVATLNDKFKKKEASYKEDMLALREQMEEMANDTQKIDEAVNAAVAPILAKSNATQTRMQSEIDRLREQLDLKNNQDSALPAIASFNPITIDDYKIEADNLRSQLQMFKDRDEQQRSRLNEAIRDVNDKNLSIGQLKEEIEELNEELSRLTAKNKELERTKTQYEELQKTSADQAKQLRDLKNEKDTLDAKLAENANEITKKDAKISDLLTQLDESVKWKNDDDSKSSELQTLYQQRIDDFESLIKTSNDEEKMTRLLNVIKKEEGNVKSLRQQVKDLNFQMTEKTWRAQNAQKELEDMKEEMRNKIEQISSTIKMNQETYEKERQQLEETIANKDKEINELREQITELE
ncbi:hypothetical protein WA158_000916 [Blastocystis sp. Blastoise]